MIVKIENYVNHLKPYTEIKTGRVVRPKKNHKNKKGSQIIKNQSKNFWFTERNRNASQFSSEHKTIACDILTESKLSMKKETICESFMAALVIEPKPKYYECVVTVDCKSLYPTTMIQNNIRPDT